MDLDGVLAEGACVVVGRVSAETDLGAGLESEAAGQDMALPRAAAAVAAAGAPLQPRDGTERIGDGGAGRKPSK